MVLIGIWHKMQAGTEKAEKRFCLIQQLQAWIHEEDTVLSTKNIMEERQNIMQGKIHQTT